MLALLSLQISQNLIAARRGAVLAIAFNSEGFLFQEKKMTIKTCPVCGENKNICEFHRRRNKKKNGYRYPLCKTCHNKNSAEDAKGFKGLTLRIFHAQCASSKKRGHNIPSYTINELRLWILNNPEFNKIYQEWIDSGYKKNNRPSIDRLDNNLGYSFDNIRLTNWNENVKAAAYDSKHGIGPCGIKCKGIIQKNIKGEEVAQYISTREAERICRIDHGDISRCANGKIDFAGGYIWEFIA
jgi:hypothetical protein